MNHFRHLIDVTLFIDVTLVSEMSTAITDNRFENDGELLILWVIAVRVTCVL